MDPQISQSRRYWLYGLLATTVVIHVLQVLAARSHHRVLEFSFATFVGLIIIFFTVFEICSSANSHCTVATYPAFVTLELVGLLHGIFIQV